MAEKNCFVYIPVALFFAFNGSRPVFCRIGGSDSGRHTDTADWNSPFPLKRIKKNPFLFHTSQLRYLAISLSCYLKKARSRNNGQNLSKDANLEEIWFATKLTLSVIPGAKLNGLITSFDQFIISSTGHLYLTGDYPW